MPQNDLPITYNIAIELEGEQNYVIDWGNTPGWMDTHRELLDTAVRISLIPKQKGTGPAVSVHLDGEKRWVCSSRVFGQISGGQEKKMRIYFIGWQMTINGKNVKSIQWVYPTGAVELADEPTLVHYFMKALG